LAYCLLVVVAGFALPQIQSDSDPLPGIPFRTQPS